MAASQTMASALTVRPSTAVVARRPAARTVVRAPLRTRQVTQAISDVNLVIGGSTVAALALGRFVFLPFQRKAAEKAGLPLQNGITHAEAGDRLAEEASFALKTNDPAGFNIVDVLAWGALGHAAGYFLLAANSLYGAGFDPRPF
eukprot:jgi/Botrbrau1/13484/Bobra.0082s0080.1